MNNCCELTPELGTVEDRGDHEKWVAFMLRRVYNLGSRHCPKSRIRKEGSCELRTELTASRFKTETPV